MTKIKVKHNKYGHVYKASPNTFLRGHGCPHCKSSKSEEKIGKYLIQNNIHFISQYTFKDLRGLNGGLLMFDFAIENHKNELFLIEYDGEFHYEVINSDEQALIRQQEHDRRKDEYCKLHNIKLYRIPYWERDNLIERLEEILIIEKLIKQG